MSLKALHSEPAEMTYSAWCTDRSQHNSEKSTVSYVTPALSTINVAPQNGEKKTLYPDSLYIHTCGPH